MSRLSDYDRNVLLIIFGLTTLVIALSTGLELVGLISLDLSWSIDLMAIAWWFGAVMTFAYDRYKKRNAPLAQR